MSTDITLGVLRCLVCAFTHPVQMQAALEGNRAHQRQVESLQYDLDEHGRTLSDDVRKKMASLREVTC